MSSKNYKYSPFETNIELALYAFKSISLSPNSLSQPKVFVVLICRVHLSLMAGTVFISLMGVSYLIVVKMEQSTKSFCGLICSIGSLLMITDEVSKCIFSCSMPMATTQASEFQLISGSHCSMTLSTVSLTIYR